jgi:hypothetical protein
MPGYRPLIMQQVGEDVVPTQTLEQGEWQISYNGIDFGPLTTANLTATPTPDPAKTTIIGTLFTLNVKSSITGSSQSDTDTIIDNVRQALGVNGATLSIYGIGVGNIEINAGAESFFGTWDVMNGPWPGAFVVNPQGGGITSLIEWSVSWFVPDCSNAVYDQDLGFLYHNYSISYAQDAAGYTTRTINGRLAIPQHRSEVGGRFPSGWADTSREYLETKFPLRFSKSAFRRTYPSISMSEDRQTLSYTIVDTEMGENIPPPGCVMAEADFTYQTETNYGLSFWTGTLNAKYEVCKGSSIGAAVNGYLELLAEKMSYAISVTQDYLNKSLPNPKAVVPLNFSMRHPSIYGKKMAEFSTSWTLTSTVKQLLEGGGIWSQLADNNYEAWVTSLEGTALSIRGLAKLGKVTYISEAEDIQDLCHPLPNNPGEEEEEEYTDAELKTTFADILAQLMTPTKESSWIYYETRLEFDQDDGISEIRTLPVDALTNATDLTGDYDAMDDAEVDDLIGNGDNPNYPPEDLIKTSPAYAGTTYGERRVRPARTVFLVGRASRYGFPVPQPRLDYISSNGEKFPVVQACREERGERFVQQSYASPVLPVSGTPIPRYEAIWSLRYIILGDPPDGNYDPPANPYTGSQSGSSSNSPFTG